MREDKSGAFFIRVSKSMLLNVDKLAVYRK